MPAPAVQPIAPGIIEGFFGKPWSWQTRTAYAEFLATAGYGFYLYAPKSDAFLRRRWQEDWPTDTLVQLKALRQVYADHGLDFGLGLSPFEIHLDASPAASANLVRKVHRLNELEPDILCLLFDDMRGDLPSLAQIQIDLVHLAAEHSHANKIIFCPSYYSFDPVLEKVFGQRPKNYWEDIGAGLDKHVQIFWTGPKVCSTDYPVEHLQEVSQLLQRQPFLWDNYPVNDGAVKSRHLQLRAFGRNHRHLSGHIAGHAVNPMNQAFLSQIPLLSLPQAYRGKGAYNPQQAFADACSRICGPALAEALMEDVGLLQDLGLGQLDDHQRQQLLTRYQKWAHQEPCAQEVCDWLNGHYAFDPTCLTE